VGLQAPPLNDLKCPWRSPPALLCPGVTAGTATSVRRRNRSTPSVLRKGFEHSPITSVADLAASPSVGEFRPISVFHAT
jgi:hypothetical protein